MPQLPEAIWKRRLENEHGQLAASGEKFEVNESKTEYVISLNQAGLAKDGGQVYERDKHAVQINLNRNYPYAGGIEITWLSPIFHPNIREEDGAVCIQLVNKWSETQTVASVVKALKQLLENPNPDSPLNHEAARYYTEKGYTAGSIDENKPRIISQ